MRRSSQPLRRDEDGLAMILAITAVFLVMAITAFALTASFADLKSARAAAARADGRTGAERALDQLAVLANSKSGITALQQKITQLAGTANTANPDGWWGWKPDAGDRPAVQSQATDLVACNATEINDSTYSAREAWATCVKVKARGYDGTAAPVDLGNPGVSGALNKVAEISIEVIARSRCNVDGGAVIDATCTFTRYQQRLRARSYFPYLMLSDSNGLAPNAYAPGFSGILSASQVKAECGAVYDSLYGIRARPKTDTGISGSNATRGSRCLDVAFLGGDRVTGGNVHTNDDETLVCQENGAVVVFGSGSSVSNRSTGPAVSSTCSTPAAGATFTTQSRVAIPDTQSPLRDLAEASGTTYVNTVPSSLTTIALDGNQMRIDGNPVPVPLPAQGVFWSAGNVAIRGRLEGRLTVRALGSISITGDLWYGSDLDPQRAFNGFTQGADPGRNLLGLIADQDVTLACATTCNDQVVMAAIVATGYATPPSAPPSAPQALDNPYGGIYNRDWWSAKVQGGPPKLYFFGAMVSRYRPVFGAYDRWNKNLVTGWQKDFVYDARLRAEQPPYMLTPSEEPFDRLDLSVLPCNDGTTNACT